MEVDAGFLRAGQRCENSDWKLRSGQPVSGVERLPGTGRPLDPDPGLGGIFKSRLVIGESK
jgi:hypothetical protein